MVLTTPLKLWLKHHQSSIPQTSSPHHILLCLTLLWSSEKVMIWVLPIHTLLDCLLPLIFKMIVHPEYQFWTGQPKSATTAKSTFKHTGSASTWEKVKNTFSRSESPKCQNKQGGCFSFCICAIPVTHSMKLCLSHQQLLLICIKYQNSISYCTFGSETYTNSTFFWLEHGPNYTSLLNWIEIG